MDDIQFRSTMGKFATGVTVVLTEMNGEVHGMTVNAFMSVSLNPKLVTISIGENARFLKKIKSSNVFSVNILAADQADYSRIFSGKLKDDFQIDFNYLNGKPVLPGSLAQIACEVVAEHTEGDHVLFIGKVADIHVEEKDPLVFYGGKYHSLADK
jgi:flavin reductase (DIM6/NTAB) family NADH-FMN oxidoreductase RutF